MDDKRFDKIKSKLENFDGHETGLQEVIDYGLELIATVEAAQAVGKIWQERETELIKQLDRMKAKNKLLIAEVEEHNCACGDALDSLWKEILINHPDYGDWTYPGEAYRHIKAEFDDLRKQLAEAERSVARLLDERDELIQHLVDHNIHECMHNPLQECRIENELLRKQLNVSHAVNKVALHTIEIQNVTIDLMKDDEK